MGGLMDPQEWHTGSLGSIPASIEMKLVDYAEAGYLSSSNPPQGEIWIRGDSVMEGYCDNDEDTRSAMAPDGWLRTGDIGQWEPNGHFRIIDRKKNLVKTLNGEYIALEKVINLRADNLSYLGTLTPVPAGIRLPVSHTRSQHLRLRVPPADQTDSNHHPITAGAQATSHSARSGCFSQNLGAYPAA